MGKKTGRSLTSRRLATGAAVGIVGAAAWGAAPALAGAQTRHAKMSSLPKTLTIFSQGDVNVQNEWTKVLVPGFEKAYPGTKIKLVFSTSASENTLVYDEIAASAKSKRASSFDIVDGAVPAEAATAGLLTKVTEKQIPRLKDVNGSAFVAVDHAAVPLRGSQVVLAYNSSVVAHPPTTLSGLISWIKANPGKFTYCNPSDGGSGEGFVQDVLSAYTPGAENKKMSLGYDQGAEKAWSKGFSVLKSIGSDIFQQQYPNSNTGVVTLLGSGAIDMGTVWSDQGTAALADGQLPKNIKLIGLKPAMPGGPDYLGVPRNIPHAYKQLAYDFINWALKGSTQAAITKVMNGTPGIEVKYLPAAIQKKFAGFGTPSLPYSAKTQSDMESQWTNVVG
jgi:putative spermidine/putrescine transport system substrate-binding protein